MLFVLYIVGQEFGRTGTVEPGPLEFLYFVWPNQEPHSRLCYYGNTPHSCFKDYNMSSISFIANVLSSETFSEVFLEGASIKTHYMYSLRDLNIPRILFTFFSFSFKILNFSRASLYFLFFISFHCCFHCRTSTSC